MVLSARFDSVTANTTTSVNGGQPHRRAVALRMAISCLTVPADSDGAITMIGYKYDASANAAVALTAAFDLEAIAAAKESEEIDLLSTLTDDELRFDEGDTFYVVVTNDSAAINTQPAGTVVTLELGLLE